MNELAEDLRWIESKLCGPSEYQIGKPKCGRSLIGAADELDRLQAIVDKLEKTADDVPVVPGETYYATWCDGETWPVCECMYVGHARPHVDYDWEIEGWPFDCEDSPEFSVWSTREAAEAAREGE